MHQSYLTHHFECCVSLHGVEIFHLDPWTPVSIIDISVMAQFWISTLTIISYVCFISDQCSKVMLWCTQNILTIYNNTFNILYGILRVIKDILLFQHIMGAEIDDDCVVYICSCKRLSNLVCVSVISSFVINFLQETCRYCKENWEEHFGKRCSEIEKQDETKLRIKL